MTEVPEDQLRDMERGEEAMESDLEKLGDRLETAQSRAEEQRQRIEVETKTFEQAGTSPENESDSDDDGEGGGAPVYEAQEVTPQAGGDESSDSDDDSGSSEGGGGSVSMADVPVHEAEQVDPKDDDG